MLLFLNYFIAFQVNRKTWETCNIYLLITFLTIIRSSYQAQSQIIKNKLDILGQKREIKIE